MATIQVRNVPPETHRTYRQRAAAAGMSLQAYLLAELVRGATLKTPAEVAAEVDRRMRVEGMEGYKTGSSAGIVRSDRQSH